MLAWAEGSDTTSAGAIGPEFSTSGPGAGWSTTHGVEEFASRAFDGGALYYLDVSDGRVKEAVPVPDEVEVKRDEDGNLVDEDGEAVQRDIGGCYYQEGDWSDGSEVRLEVPDLDDALEHPEVVAEMAQAVIDYHGPMSDRKRWAKLVRDIKSAADALDGIDADDLDAE